MGRAGHQIQTISFVLSRHEDQVAIKNDSQWGGTEATTDICPKPKWHTFLRRSCLTCLVEVADVLATFESRLFFFHLIQKVNICSRNTALRLWPCSLNGCLFYYRRHWKSLQTSGSANGQKCYLKGSVQRGGHLPCWSQKGLFPDFQTPRAVTVLMFGWLKVSILSAWHPVIVFVITCET